MINTPLELSACVIWLNGADSTNFKQLSGGTLDVVNNDPVGFWRNLGSLSGTENPVVSGHFTNIGGTNATRPTYISSLSCLRFDNAQYLTLSATQDYTAQTVFVATSPRAFADQDRIYSQAASGVVDNNTYLPLVQTGTTGGVCSYTGAATTARSSTSHRALSTFDTFTSWHSGGGIRNFRNGETASTTFAHTLGTLTVLRHRIGASIAANATAANFYSGDISEVIVYSRALTNAEREDVEYYLSRKWSVLNSIPRQVYALKNGNWSDTDIWSVSADPVPWNVPLSADNVYTNSFTVTANSSTKVHTIRNSTLAPNIAAGGGFVLANGVSLSAGAVTNDSLSGIITLNNNVSATLVSNISGSNVGGGLFFDGIARVAAITLRGNNVLNIRGSIVTQASTSAALSAANNSVVNVTGNVLQYRDNGDIFSNNTIVLESGSSLNLTGNVGVETAFGGRATNSYTIINRSTGSVNVIGTVFAGRVNGDNNGGDCQGIFNASTGTVNITGNCIGISLNGSNFGGNSASVRNGSSGIVNILGNIFTSTGNNGNFQSPTIFQNSSNGIVNIRGNVFNSNNCSGIRNSSTGRINVLGDIIPTSTATIATVDITTGVLSITGNVVGQNAVNTIVGTSTTLPLSVYGNIINAPNGRQAIYAPRYQVFPSSSPTYTRHAVNGYDSFVDYWTSDATFSYPLSSDVRLSTTYNNGALTGSMVLPPPSSVYFGVPLGTASLTVLAIQPGVQYRITTPGNTNFRLIGSPSNNRGTTFTATGPGTGTGLVTLIGTAFLTPESLWNTSVNTITNQDGNVGRLLKNVLTYQTLTAYRTGTSFNQAQNLSLFSFADYWSDNLPWDDNIFVTLSS